MTTQDGSPSLWKKSMKFEGPRANQFLIEQDEFDRFAAFLKKACGISLAANKQYLVSTRIRRLLQDNNIESFAELVRALQDNQRSRLREQIIDAMTTNETYWFRDAYPFEYLKNDHLRTLYQSAGGREIRVWSAACSSGQEPYSISMAVEEYNQHHHLSGGQSPVHIVATDLSPSMLQMGCMGVYDKLAMARGLSAERLGRFFDPVADDKWRVKDKIKARVDFRYLNLLDSYGGLGKFDVIFCRNVLIYFSSEIKQDILRRLHAALKPNGMLCLGSSEGVTGASHLFKMIYCNPGIMYQAK